ncbi:recombination mediator RecR [Vampirovibrio chlorellavorus]|jgi:recombination protein RecR|uniref:recombination mediator RecR n=1 Tax=Vampirovibrio chlorellavorus TaxID=758823 RepID=UPI000A998EB6|nr:recombination mediator RecR [Vampirovibrio chlorellavorus]
MSYTLPLARLIEEFQKLPGIGPKSAQRLAFHVLKQPPEDVRTFSDALLEARDKIGYCQQCFNLSAQSVCELCVQPNRKQQTICLVSEPKDLYALERTGEFKGVYHVLQGLISPLEGISPEDLKIKELLARLSNPDVEEVILALPPSIEGDTTSLYLSRLIKPLGIKLTRIAFGLPVGADLEYADSMTITRALQGRQSV